MPHDVTWQHDVISLATLTCLLFLVCVWVCWWSMYLCTIYHGKRTEGYGTREVKPTSPAFSLYMYYPSWIHQELTFGWRLHFIGSPNIVQGAQVFVKNFYSLVPEGCPVCMRYALSLGVFLRSRPPVGLRTPQVMYNECDCVKTSTWTPRGGLNTGHGSGPTLLDRISCIRLPTHPEFSV